MKIKSIFTLSLLLIFYTKLASASLIFSPSHLKTDQAKVVVVIQAIIQGSADTVVNPSHGKRIISDFIGNTKAVTTNEDSAGGLQYSTSNYLSDRSSYHNSF